MTANKTFSQDFLKNLITKSPGPLSTHHQEWDSIDGCINCHQKALGGEIANDKCLTCHPRIEVRLKENRGFHRGKNECHTCHEEHKGKDGLIFAPENWKNGFDHETDAQYALRGKHAAISCENCHEEKRSRWDNKKATQTLSYLDAPTSCYGCHADDNIHGNSSKLVQKCESCHSTQIVDWKKLAKPMSFKHDQTDYPLKGLHTKVSCESCHNIDQSKLPKIQRKKSIKAFAPMKSAECTNCHQDPHKGKFGNDCESCHSVFRKWDSIIVGKGVAEKFDHDTTRFPLVGYHQAVECDQCHGDNLAKKKFEKAEFDQCSDCHGQAHQDQFSKQDCESCHKTENRWFDSLYDIERHNKTDFQLTGKHQVLDCQKCHFSGQYENLPHEECSDCHRVAHPDRQIDQSCNFCHVTTSFSWIQFDHNKNTKFELTGKHRDVACLSCHVDQVFKNMPADNANPNCQMCHQDPHGEAIQNDCASCHRTEGFKLVRDFDHAKTGDWELQGRHAELSCQKCHSKHLLGNYEVPKFSKSSSDTACVNCHSDIHRGKFGSSCQSCHNYDSFEVEHGEKVHDLGFFKLEGVHDLMDCQVCHQENTNIQGVGNTCAWCHEKNDIHLGKMGNECSDCHRQTSWLPTTFRHNTTGFRLTGAHRYADCESCHVNQNYQGQPNDCYFCHSDSFVSYIPSHNGGRGSTPQDCASCHSTIDWNILVRPGIDKD